MLRGRGSDSRAASALAASLALVAALAYPAPVEAQDARDTDGRAPLVRVVGCLRADSGDLPWVLERAGEPAAATTAYTSDEELQLSADQALGTREFRLIGGERFRVEPHAGHKVQAKGLIIEVDDEWRLNLTSFQHVAPSCGG